MHAGSSACPWTPSDAFTLTVHKTTSVQILLGDVGKDPHAVSRHKKAILFFCYNFWAFYYPLKLQVWISYATKQPSEGSKAIE